MARRRSVARDLARERSLVLYVLAVRCLRDGRADRARDYVRRAVEILRRNRARRPAYYRRWVCERCLAPLVPGLTARVRLRGTRSHVLIVKRCLLCGWISRTAVERRGRPPG